MQTARKRVCLYFGSFNPIHRGHIALAQYAAQELDYDGVWLVLSPLSPHKNLADQLPYSLRAALISEALFDQPALSLCTIEQGLPAPHYTVRTINALRLLHPQANFTLLIGADNLRSISTWHEHERLRSAVELLVYPRPGCTISDEDVQKSAPNARISLCHGAPLMDISSSEIRRALHANHDLRHWLPRPERWEALRTALETLERSHIHHEAIAHIPAL